MEGGDSKVFVLSKFVFFFFLDMIGYDVFCVCDNNIGLCLCIIVKKDVFFFLIDNILNKVSGVIGVVKIIGEISFLVEFILVFWLVNEYVFFLCVFFYFKS